MNRLFKTTICWLALTVDWSLLAQTHVKFDLAAPYFNALPASNRVVTLQPLTPFPGNLITYTSSASGIFYHSNSAVGDFAGVVTRRGQAGEIKFQITVTATNLGVVNADTITSVLGQQTYPTAGRSSWSIQSSDQRFLKSPTNAATASDGQVVSKTGDKTKYIDPGEGTGAFSTGAQLAVATTNGSTITITVATNAVGQIATDAASTKANTNAPTIFTPSIHSLPDSVSYFYLTTTNSGATHYWTNAVVIFHRNEMNNTISTRPWTVLLMNTNELVGGTDAQNEVELAFSTGYPVTGNPHRGYIGWYHPDGSAFSGKALQWVFGVNSNKTVILNDSRSSVHRLWFEAGNFGSQYGMTYINSASNGAVRINAGTTGADSTALLGTGGFEVWSGGPSGGQTNVFKVTAAGTVGINSTIYQTNVTDTKLAMYANGKGLTNVNLAANAIPLANGSAAVAGTDYLAPNGDGSGLTAVNAATVTVADSTDATSFVGMFDSATGNLAPKTDAALTYNASSGQFTAGSLRSSAGAIITTPATPGAGTPSYYLAWLPDGQVQQYVNGSLWEDLNASELTSGTIPPARMATNAASAGLMLHATSATTAKWDTAPSGGTTYTNNTGLPGVVVGSGIGTNLSTLAALAGNNIFTGSNTFNGGFYTTIFSVGTLDANDLIATNFFVRSNLPPATPDNYGDVYFNNSNGILFAMFGNLNADTWNRTNRFLFGDVAETRVAFGSATAGILEDDAGMTYAKASDGLTVAGFVSTPIVKSTGNIQIRPADSASGLFDTALNVLLGGRNHNLSDSLENTNSATAAIRGGIVGGDGNFVSSQDSVILGGRSNGVFAGSVDGNVIVGGFGNRTGLQSGRNVVLGGTSNHVGYAQGSIPGNVVTNSVAGGYLSHATNAGSFVWSSGGYFNSTADNQFIIKSAGGVGINTNNPGIYSLAVLGNTLLNGTITGNGSGVTNVQSTNVVGSTGVLVPTSQQTNYTIPLLTGSGNDTLLIYSANTNLFITFTGTNTAFANRSVVINSLTNTVVSRIGFASATKTNFNFVAFATNGQFKVINFFNPDTQGTNVLVSDAGYYRGGFTQ